MTSALAAAGALVVVLGVRTEAWGGSDSITVTVTGLRNDTGRVGCLLFASADGFPKDAEKAAARRLVPITNKSATCVFENLRPGRYAVLTMHDENSNGKLDRNLLGMPIEGVGTSGSLRARFRPPSFDDASFPYPGGALTVPITVRYL
jgi:uncharacterized protein (DUF2141 family)